MKYVSSLCPKLIYIFRINDDAHEGCLKIGETTFNGDQDITTLQPDCAALQRAAKDRINSYTQTAGIVYELLYTELALYSSGKQLCAFNDKAVHEVLRHSGIEQKCFNTEKRADEWFITDLETAKKAIAAVKAGRCSLNAHEISHDQSPIAFRPEQRAAIDKTLKQFGKSGKMLWNAKMRFGKTVCALQVAKEIDAKRTLIFTHRPAVNAGWHEDFQKIFYDRKDFRYGSKTLGESFESLKTFVEQQQGHGIYFASLQDLRGSERTGGKFDKNNEVFDAAWDYVIIDEAHEGTKTDLGQNVFKAIIKKGTKSLHLSGTPFNLFDEYKADEIYTWDYAMEQKAKQEWDLLHFGDPNPYASLPRLNIFTFDLGKRFADYADAELAFNFHEFFKVDANGRFIHGKDVSAFLHLICQTDDASNYPYSTQEYRDNFRHSLWMVPGVKAAKALSAMLQAHPVFGQFRIVNVAGNGDEDEENDDALKMVKDAIAANDYTITLSCGRLTTGVSVPEWTAVFMLAGSFSTSAASYMQTIFRVQTPAVMEGKTKEECFAFDFAPDRTLKVLADAARAAAKADAEAGGKKRDDREAVQEFLNFCPVIASDGTRMAAYDVDRMLAQLKRVYVERVVQHGFDDPKLYNNDLMMTLTGKDLSEFNDLKKIIGTTKAMPQSGEIDVNAQGFTDEQYKALEEAERRKRRKEALTPEQQELLEKHKEQKKQRDTAISILRGISIRMPLMIYGAELTDESQEITIDNFAELIDHQSWLEFMPQGVSKQRFNNFKKYYDPDIFRESGKRIRDLAKSADSLPIEERIERITTIFGDFRNPDKETVLTPWRVVNMHLSDCIGGYAFFDENFERELMPPRLVDRGEVTRQVFSADAQILEINSKSGLYPLYAAYSVYKARQNVRDLFGCAPKTDTIEEQHTLWQTVLAENIFVICKTPMAKSITRRTLLGFRDGKVNAQFFADLVDTLKNNPNKFISKVSQRKYWNLEGNGSMQFDAIIGNPPYQEKDGSGGSNDASLYQYFVEAAHGLQPDYVSIIMPSRWFSGGRENLLSEFRQKMLNRAGIKSLYVYPDAREVFSNVEIKGGICYYLYDKNHSGECTYTLVQNGKTAVSNRALNELEILIRDPQVAEIVKKVMAQVSDECGTVASIISGDTPFGIPTNPASSKKKNFSLYKSASNTHTLQLFYIDKMHRKIAYIDRKQITKNEFAIDLHKVFIPKAAGSGNDPQVVGYPEYACPNSACSQTFLYAAFSCECEAKNFISYLKTKFFRLLVSACKLSQDIPAKTYRFVPLQDFTNASDIDWKRSVREIDAQLYKKYGLSQEEIAFIESTIKPME